MDATLVCDCGEQLHVSNEPTPLVCPDCRASYAVTVTKIRQAETVRQTD